MTTPTPTSSLPTGLPREEELAALASEFFRKGIESFNVAAAQVPALPQGPALARGLADTAALQRTLPSASVFADAASLQRTIPLASALGTGVGLQGVVPSPLPPADAGGLFPGGLRAHPAAGSAGFLQRAIDTSADAQARLDDLVRQATSAFAPSLPGASDSVQAALSLAGGEALRPHLVAAPQATSASPVARYPGFEVEALRRDFPILQERVHGDRKLVWLDNAATTQKPKAVIDRLAHFYSHENSNIHRAAHELARRATDAYEDARAVVAGFLGAAGPEEILFVRGATEAINLVANVVAAARLHPGDEILLSHLEHHANIVPWQQVAQRVGAVLRVIPVGDRGDLRLDALSRLIGPRTRVVAFTHVSNALGTITPVREIVEAAHRAGALVLLDGAQSVSHLPVDVRSLGVDFFVFSGHKLFGPTGIGAVYGRRELLQELPPWQGGGNMIRDVTFERTEFREPPERFEAGTGNIADAVGLAAAIRYLQSVGMERIAGYESALTAYGREALARVNGLSLLGNPRHHASVLSFTLKGHANEAVGRHLDQAGIAVRAGHHCAQPILRRFGLESSVRASLVFYNTFEEIDYLVETLGNLRAG